MAALGTMVSSTPASDSPGSLGDDLDTTRSSSITETISHEDISVATTAATITNATTTISPSTLEETSTTQVSAEATLSSTNAATSVEISPAEQTDFDGAYSSPTSQTVSSTNTATSIEISPGEQTDFDRAYSSQTSQTVSSTNATTSVEISTAEQTDVDIDYSSPISVTEETASESDLTTMDDTATTTVVASPWQPSMDQKLTTGRSNRITDHSTDVHIEPASTVTRSSTDVSSTSSQLPSTLTSATEIDIPVLKTTVTSQDDVTRHIVVTSGATTVKHNVTATRMSTISVDNQTTTQAPAANATLWLGVGLGVGALLIVILIILIVCCCRKRRCRRRKRQYDEDYVKEYEIVYNPSRKPYKRSFEKGNTNENLAPKRANYFEEGLRTGVENPNYHFVPDKGSDSILRNKDSNNIKGLEAESRFSIGPVMLDDEGISSTGETYDKMYRTHNTFRRGEQAPK